MTEEKYFENIKTYALMAKKEVGQNFLIDAGKAYKIVDLLDIKKGEKVLEIGSGAGSLTYFLSKSWGEVTAIDIDEALILKLQNDFEGYENLKIMRGNAMDFDYAPYDKIVGNLPYYITSGIIENVLLGAKKASKFVFMVQKEAYSRLVAPIGDKDYSPLNIYLNYAAKIHKAFAVSASSFSPAPHVDSVVFEGEFLDEGRRKDGEEIYQLAKALFLSRRKTVYNNLRAYLGDEVRARESLEKANIPLATRPDKLSAADYLNLKKALQ